MARTHSLGRRHKMPKMRVREALGAALAEELRRDERVILMGEDIGAFGGAFGVTGGLLDEFGPKRVIDTPIAENSFVGIAAGAAMHGLIPVVELMTINFSLIAMDEIINHIAAIPYMFAGQEPMHLPLVLRAPQGGGHQLGPTHSHSLEALYTHIPGLLVATPVTAADAKGLLKSAIREPNPVIFIEHEALYGRQEEVSDDPELLIPFGCARIAREGQDVSIIAVSRMVLVAEEAAVILEKEHGISAEVIDPRTLRPLDVPAILASVKKTNRCVIVEEGWPRCGIGADLASIVAYEGFDDLDAPVERVSGADLPMPYAKNLEQAAMNHPEDIVQAALATLGSRAKTTAAPAAAPSFSSGVVLDRRGLPVGTPMVGAVPRIIPSH